MWMRARPGYLLNNPCNGRTAAHPLAALGVASLLTLLTQSYHPVASYSRDSGLSNKLGISLGGSSGGHFGDHSLTLGTFAQGHGKGMGMTVCLICSRLLSVFTWNFTPPAPSLLSAQPPDGPLSISSARAPRNR